MDAGADRPLSTRAPIAELRVLCPGSRDSLSISREGYASPAVYFDLGGIEVVAVQFRTALDPTLPADGWILEPSDRLALPENVAGTATWAELDTKYGSAAGSTEMGPLVVWFCDRPAFSFSLDADPEEVGSPEVDGDLSRVPPEAKITEIGLDPDQGEEGSRYGCEDAPDGIG